MNVSHIAPVILASGALYWSCRALALLYPQWIAPPDDEILKVAYGGMLGGAIAWGFVWLLTQWRSD